MPQAPIFRRNQIVATGSGSINGGGVVGQNSVDTTELADMAANTVRVNNTSSTGDPVDMAMAASTILARLASGDIKAASVSEILTLLNVEAGATADQSDAEIKTAYENNANTNAFTDAAQTKLGFLTITQNVNLDGVENTANSALQDVIDDTTPQLGGDLDVNSFDITSTANIDLKLGDAAGANKAVIKDSVGVEVAAIDSDGNITTSGTVDGRDIAADGTKLDGIEASADVTDEANVKSALDGATLTAVTVAGTDKVLVQDADDSDNLKTVTAQSIADLSTAGLANVVEDTTPQLGGNLDLNSNDITGTGRITTDTTTEATTTTDGSIQTDGGVSVAKNLVVGGQAWSPTATLTDAATIATDCNNGNVFTVTLAGNRTLGAPSNLRDGAMYTWIVKQDATGSRTLAYNAVFKWQGGSAPVLSTGANDIDILSGVSDGTNVYMSIGKDYS